MRTKLCAVLVVAMGVAGCSPGSLPGSPSPILSGGGGGRYDGTLTYRRVGGSFAVNEAAQGMTLSLELTADDQFSAQFTAAGGSRGSLQGTLNGALNNGTFLATLLVTTPVSRVAASTIAGFGSFFRPAADGDLGCDGRGDVTGTFSGPNVTWTGSITYPNCPGLVTTSQAQASAISPIPRAEPARARVIITVFPGTTIQLGRCDNGTQGYQFTVELVETAGVAVTLDDTFVVEERKGGGQVVSSRTDNPFTSISAGEKRRYSGCEPATGTYQAFFSGKDANGNDIRFASPLVTFGRPN